MTGLLNPKSSERHASLVSKIVVHYSSLEYSDHGIMYRGAIYISTIELHPKFSDAPHCRSFTPLLENRLPQKSNCILTNNPMAPKYTNKVIFRSKIEILTVWGLRDPVVQKTGRPECDTSIVERARSQFSGEV